MAESFVGEIRMFGGNFAPAGWATCAGQLLPIAENDALFSLIGTTYGGDGQTTFALPDLRSRIPVHQGGGLSLAQNGGAENVRLTVSQLPGHTHALMGSTANAATADPTNNVGARVTVAGVFPYGTDAPLQPLAPQAVSAAGGDQPHDNLQPFLCINFIISLYGIYPSQS
jgi:microcystin-dependent protein